MAIAPDIATDLVTPLGAYLRLRREGRAAFLLESVERGRLGRHSFVGCGSHLCYLAEAEACGEPVVGYLAYDYAASVRAAKEHIEAGDVFQVVLSQRAERPTSASALELYRALRRVNPSPYLFLLVDLGRNDLARVCVPGTVEVERFLEVERYSHVTHLVSQVGGNLREGVTPFDLLRACFPAGTVDQALRCPRKRG